MIHLNLYKKYRLPVMLDGLRWQVKIEKSMRTVLNNLRKNIFHAIVQRNKADQTFFFDFYHEKLVYKVLFSLRKYRDKRFQVKKNKETAQRFLNSKLIHKSLFGFGLKVQSNQHLRKDLIKRYYIDNSDGENSYRANGVEPLEDEFFDVTICTREKYLKIKDPQLTFVHDRLEHRPEVVILNNRSQVEVNYKLKEDRVLKLRKSRK